MTSCPFPTQLSVDDEVVAEPWYSVGEHDVFPEEFAPFMVPAGLTTARFQDL